MVVTRKITIPAAKAKAVAVVKPVAKAAAPVVSTPKVVIVKPKRAPATPRIEHDVVSPYTGPSLGLNKRKSKTALDLAAFGSAPEYVLTGRTEQVGKALRQKYGNKPFVRANADAGILNYLGRKGFIAHVSGDAASEACTLQFTAEGLKHLPAH